VKILVVAVYASRISTNVHAVCLNTSKVHDGRTIHHIHKLYKNVPVNLAAYTYTKSKKMWRYYYTMNQQHVLDIINWSTHNQDFNIMHLHNSSECFVQRLVNRC